MSVTKTKTTPPTMSTDKIGADKTDHVSYSDLFKINVVNLTQFVRGFEKKKYKVFDKGMIISSLFQAMYQICSVLDNKATSCRRWARPPYICHWNYVEIEADENHRVIN